VAMLAELIGVLKKIRTCVGGALIVEPSTGSEPITKDDASAAGVRIIIGNQLSVINMQRLSTDIIAGLRKHPCRIKPFMVV
jgi:hypothetical protein